MVLGFWYGVLVAVVLSFQEGAWYYVAINFGKQPQPESIIARLQKGHGWLMQNHIHLLSQKDVGIGTTLETVFLDAYDLWDGLDHLLRHLWDYKGCVMGEGKACPADSPIYCRGCATPEV